MPALREHRYYYVWEDPNLKEKWSDNEENWKIRYFLISKEDRKDRIPLHLACMFGDSHFTFMLVKEALFMKKKVAEAYNDA